MVIKLNRRAVAICLTALILIISVALFVPSTVPTTAGMPLAGRCIVVDAGHGGLDGGAISPSGVCEKDINLNIARYLKEYLVQGGAGVIMTRESDISLHEDERSSIKDKKRSDLLKRREMVNGVGADIFVSIHLNQFSQAQYKGAQVFYESKNPSSRVLADCLQRAFKANVDGENKRMPASIGNDKILFRDLKVPSVIAECGFLSNPEEERMLQSEEYQKKLALAIYLGIVEYFNQ